MGHHVDRPTNAEVHDMRPILGLTLAKRRNGILVAALATCLAASACTSTSPAATGAPQPESTAAKGPLTLTVSPDNGVAGMPASTEIGITVGNGSVTDVAVVNAATGQPVSGAMRADGTTWVPAEPLAYGTQYTATATARS